MREFKSSVSLLGSKGPELLAGGLKVITIEPPVKGCLAL